LKSLIKASGKGFLLILINLCLTTFSYGKNGVGSVEEKIKKFEQELQKSREILLEEIDEIDKVEEEKETAVQNQPEEKGQEIKRILTMYFFLDAYHIRGQEDIYERKGEDLIGRLGIRFAYQIKENLSFWSDVYVGAGYQKFMEDDQTKLWWDIRYLYLSNTNLPYRDKYGFGIKAGRVPVIDRRGFWFYNYLDGLYLSYRKTLLQVWGFVGTRAFDTRVGTNEESVNIQGYTYFIGNIKYQYFYQHFASLYLIGEYKNDFSNLSSPDVWEGVREKRKLAWVGIRLEGKPVGRSGLDYWADIGVITGTKGVVNSSIREPYADIVVRGKWSQRVSDIGLDLGAKLIKENWGLGGRLAYGGREFYLPKLSNRRSYLFGKNTIRYYGELFNPSLNNITVVSVFGGYRLEGENWITVNLLNYFKADKNYSSGYSRYFYTAKDKKYLGTEVDLIYDGEIGDNSSKWRFLVVGSYFKGSDAFDHLSRKDGYGIFFKLKRYW